MKLVIEIDEVPKNDHERWVLEHGRPLDDYLFPFKDNKKGEKHENT